jgi:hypothetical protein
MTDAALLAGAVVLSAAVLVWIVATAFRPTRCYLCRFRPASFEAGDYWICRECWDRLQIYRAIQEGIDSDTADLEIREYLREHPEAKP